MGISSGLSNWSLVKILQLPIKIKKEMEAAVTLQSVDKS
jgi:hypothetical protein